MKWLTKSDYLKFLTHPAYLWLQKHAKDTLPDFDERAQAAVDEGNLVETYARRLFPDGHLIGVHIFDGPDASRAYLTNPTGPQILAPELSYKGLGIGEGLTAQIRWVKAARGELSADEAGRVYDDLVEYCGQDTWAMVRIWQEMVKATG
jgi:hypothetical protein